NTVPNNPSAVSLRAHSRRMPSPTPPMIWRSKKFIKLMAKRTMSAYSADPDITVSSVAGASSSAHDPLERLPPRLDHRLRDSPPRRDRIDAVVTDERLNAGSQ